MVGGERSSPLRHLWHSLECLLNIFWILPSPVKGIAKLIREACRALLDHTDMERWLSGIGEIGHVGPVLSLYGIPVRCMVVEWHFQICC